MIKVTLDKATLAKLFDLTQPVEIFDEQGRLLGIARPNRGRVPDGYMESPISPEENQRLKNEPGGRPLADILRDLEKGA